MDQFFDVFPHRLNQFVTGGISIRNHTEMKDCLSQRGSDFIQEASLLNRTELN